MPNDISNEINILNTVNYMDSALFGFTIDIFKIQLFISLPESPELEEFGISKDSDLCYEFLLVEDVEINFVGNRLGPPYLDNGELSAINIADFFFEELDIKKAGVTTYTDVIDKVGEIRDRYEVQFTLSGKGKIAFKFADIKISAFDDPLKLDSSR